MFQKRIQSSFDVARVLSYEVITNAVPFWAVKIDPQNGASMKDAFENVQTLLLDVDGTLIDSNDAHAKAWVQALAENGFQVAYEEVRNKIGMGGDHLLPLVSGLDEESEEGKIISDRRGEIFRSKYLPTLQAFPQAREMLQAFLDKGLELIVATSASEEDLEKLLKQASLSDLLKKKTSSADAESSKPDPDIIQAALRKTHAAKVNVRMIGDTPYDIEAARRAGVLTIALKCGGWSADKLSGAVAIFEDPQDLLKNFHTKAGKSQNVSGEL